MSFSRLFRFNNKGFSLTEMSVVLVSVAAIVAATTGGMSLINKAKLGEVVERVNIFTKATENFETKYGSLPGDLANTASLGSSVTGGNGNGVVDAAEATLFWQHLSLSGLIEGKFDGTSRFVPGRGVPSAEIKGGGFRVFDPTTDASIPDHAIVFALNKYSSSNNNLPILTATDALSIDEKADDGNPNTGIIRGYGVAGGENCVDGNSYNVDSDEVNCSVLFVVRAFDGVGVQAAIEGACNVLGSVREMSDSSQRCPAGFEGKILESCVFDNGSSGDLVWRRSKAVCNPVECTGGSNFGETKNLKCINGQEGAIGTIQTCSKEGVWVTTFDDCYTPSGEATDVHASSCSVENKSADALSCGWGESGVTLQRCKEVDSSLDGSGCNDPTSNCKYESETDTCSQITCGVLPLGTIRTSATSCGANHLGTVTEVCTMNGTFEIVSNSCSPQYNSGTICTVDNERDISCPPGEDGEHIQVCIAGAAGNNNYWTTKSDSCKAKTCSGQRVGAVKILSPEVSCPDDRTGLMMAVCTINSMTGESQWVESDTNCSSSVCLGDNANSLSSSQNGYAIWPNAEAGVSTISALECIDGYEASGSVLPTMSCSNSGDWNVGSLSNSCVIKKCEAEISGNANWSETISSTFGVTGTCRPGKVYADLSTAPTRDCDQFGEWTDIENKCVSPNIYGPAGVVSGLQLWLDAKEDLVDNGNGTNIDFVTQEDDCNGNSVSDNENFKCWKDRNSNGNTAFTKDRVSPVYNPSINTSNLSDTVDFDSNQPSLQLSTATFGDTNLLAKTDQSYTVIIVGHSDEIIASDKATFFGKKDATASALQMMHQGSNLKVSLMGAENTIDTDPAINGVQNYGGDKFILTLTWNGSQTQARAYYNSYKNNLAVGSTNINSFIGDIAPLLGSYQKGVESLDGQLSEVIIYDRAIVSTEREKIEGYLSNKWNIPLFEDVNPCPADIDDCSAMQLWLDSSDTQTVFEDGTCSALASDSRGVGCWEDKSVNGNDVIINSSAKEPKYNTSTNLINDLPIINFDGKDDHLVEKNGNLNMSTWHYMVVAKAPKPTADCCSGPLHKGGNFQLSWNHNLTGDWTPGAAIAGDSGYSDMHTSSFGELEEDTTYLFTASFDGSNLITRKNGAQIDKNSDYSGTPYFESENLKIGSNAKLTSDHPYWEGSIGEVVIFENLSNSDQDKMEEYLMVKWGIVPWVECPGGVCGMNLWLDAADKTTLHQNISCNNQASVSDEVACWQDKSDFENDVKTLQAGPELLGGTFDDKNNLNVLDFEDNLLSASNMSDIISTQGYSAFVVFSPDTISSNNIANDNHWKNDSLFIDSSGITGLVLRNGTPSIVGITDKDGFDDSNAQGEISATIETDKYYIASLNYNRDDNSKLELSLNGYKQSSVVVEDIDPIILANDIFIGGNGTQHFNGKYGELVIYKDHVTVEEQDKIEDYLGVKWGIDIYRPTPKAVRCVPDTGISDTGLALWLDANDPTCKGVTLSNNQKMGGEDFKWKDKSGNKHDATQSDSNQQPTFNTVNTINNKPVISFDSSYFNVASFPNQEEWTISVVLRADNDPATATGIGVVHKEANFQLNWGHGNDVFRGAFALVTPSGGWQAQKLGDVKGGVEYIVTGSYDKDVLRAWNNGELIGENSTPQGSASNSSPLTIGRHANASNNYFHGDIAEVIIYNYGVSDESRADIEVYLSDKWGIPIEIGYDNIPKTNLALWLDANDPTGDGSTLWSDGQAVGGVGYEWKDKSVNELHVSQGISSQRPTFKLNALNSKPVIEFDKTSFHSLVNFDYDDSKILKNDTKGTTVFVVMKSENSNDSKEALMWNSISNGFLLLGIASNNLYFDTNKYPSAFDNYSMSDPTEYQIQTIINDNKNSETKVRIDGTPVSGDRSSLDSIKTDKNRLVLLDKESDNNKAIENYLVFNDIDYVLIGSNEDGLEKINKTLATLDKKFDEIHVFSHGSDGSIKLGSNNLNNSNIDNNSKDLLSWSSYLNDNADIMLYSCNLSLSKQGSDFVEKLSALTGADIASSNNLTGIGGDWNLENNFGQIETASLVKNNSEVNVTLNNPPIARDDKHITVRLGETIDINLFSGSHFSIADSDPDGDAIRIKSVGTPQYGTITILNRNTGMVRYTATQARPIWLYREKIIYIIEDEHGLSAPHPTNLSSQAAIDIVIPAISNVPPTAGNKNANTNYQTQVNTNLLSGNSDPDGDSISIDWVGNASNGSVSISGNDGRFTPNNGFSGNASYQYRLKDQHNAKSNTATVNINVGAYVQPNRAPTAINKSVSAAHNTPVTVNLLSGNSDPDGDSIGLYWAGSQTNGSLSRSGNNVTFRPNNGFSGNANFRYEIRDNRGGRGQGFVYINVAAGPNNPPTANNKNVSTAHNTPVTVNLLSGNSDPDGDSIGLYWAGSQTNGSLSRSGNNVTFRPNNGFSGNANFRYEIRDNRGGRGQGFVYINVAAAPNSAPTAINKNVSAAHNTPITINLLSNNSDPNGDPISVNWVGNAVNGNVSTSGGNATFTPNNSFSGNARFEYRISDNRGGTSSLATVNVTVAVLPNSPPIALNKSLSNSEQSFVVDLLNGNSDPDGDPISVDWIGSEANGTVSLSGTDATFTVPNGFEGNASFQYRLSDDKGAISSNATVSILIYKTEGNNLFIGGKNPSNGFQGSVAEIIVYDEILNKSKINVVEKYLDDKWNLDSAFPIVDNSIDRSGLALWLDANDPTGDGRGNWSDGQAVGGASYNWKDKSGNGLDVLQSDTTKQPSYINNGQNSKAVVRFTEPQEDHLYRDNVLSSSLLDDSHDEISIFYAQKYNVGDAATSSFSWREDNVLNRISLMSMWSNDYSYFDFGNPYQSANGSRSDFGRITAKPTNFEGKWNIISAIKTSSPTSKSDLFINGNLLVTGAVQGSISSGTSKMFIGGSGVNSFDGDIAEVIIYKKGLTDIQRETIESYLSTKWDISLAPPAPIIVDNSIDRSGLALWLDANDPIADGSTKWNNGQSIGGEGFYWKDKSENKIDLGQLVESQRPTYVVNGQNNKPVISMSNPSMSLATIDVPVQDILDDSLDEISITLVQKQNSPNVNTTSFQYSNAWPSGIRVYAAWSNIIYYDFGNNARARINKGITNFSNKWNIITSIKSPSPINKSTIYVNGELFHQGNVSFSFNSNYQAPIILSSMQGELAEVIMYDHALTDSNRESVESYLGTKWNISLATPVDNSIDRSGLTLWLDANDPTADGSTQFSNNQGVSEWKDKSDSELHVSQSNASYRPSYITNEQNGNPVMRFNYSQKDHFIRSGVNSSDFLNGDMDEMTLFITQKYNVSNSATSSFSWLGGGQRIQTHATWSNDHIYFDFANTSAGRTYSSLSNFEGLWKTITLTKQPSPINKNSIHINGSLLHEESAVATARGASGALSIGSYSGSAYTFDGDIAEVIVYDHALSGSQREAVESYLGSKWDITLP